MSNVERHAQARQVHLHLTWQDDQLVLTIQDDGLGMDVEMGSSRGRYGLVGMKERAELMGGNVLLSSQPGQGTTVKLTLPLEIGSQ